MQLIEDGSEIGAIEPIDSQSELTWALELEGGFFASLLLQSSLFFHQELEQFHCNAFGPKWLYGARQAR